LKKLLGPEAHSLNFFQAVHLVESIFKKKGRVGSDAELKSEAIRFETHNALSFPPGEIAALRPPLSLLGQLDLAEREKSARGIGSAQAIAPDPIAEAAAKNMPVRMELTFMGLYGVSSPLPSYFIDPITLRKVEYFQLKKFLDIFGHRFYSLFYRAWKKYRHPLQFREAGIDDYTQRLLTLTGQWPATASSSRPKLPPPGQTGEFPVGRLLRQGGHPDLKRLAFARFLGSRVRSAKGLEQLLRGYFGFQRVKVKEFVAQTVPIPVPATLGRPGTQLGSTLRIGQTMRDSLGRFEIEIGPLPAEDLNLFIPDDGAKWSGKPIDFSKGFPARIRDMVDNYLRDPFDYAVTVLVRPRPESRLGMGEAEFLLGMGTFLDSHDAKIPLRLRF